MRQRIRAWNLALQLYKQNWVWTKQTNKQTKSNNLPLSVEAFWTPPACRCAGPEPGPVWPRQRAVRGQLPQPSWHCCNSTWNTPRKKHSTCTRRHIHAQPPEEDDIQRHKNPTDTREQGRCSASRLLLYTLDDSKEGLHC